MKDCIVEPKIPIEYPITTRQMHEFYDDLIDGSLVTLAQREVFVLFCGYLIGCGIDLKKISVCVLGGRYQLRFHDE